MTNRRRNLIVLVLVLALLGGSAYVIANEKTVQGLDLRGGTELIYEGRPTPQVPEVTRGRHQPGDRDHPPARRPVRRLRAGDQPGRRQRDRGRAPGRTGHPARDRTDRHHRPALPLRLGGERDPAGSGHRRSHRASVHPADRRGQGGVEAKARSPRSSARPRAAPQTAPITCSTRTRLQPIGDPSGPQAGPVREPAAAKSSRRTRWCSRCRGARSSSRTPRRTTSSTATPGTGPVLRPARPAVVDRQRHHQPRAELRPDHQPAERHLRLHRRRPAEVPGRHPGDRPAGRRRLLHRHRPAGVDRDPTAGRAVLGQLRDRPRRRGRVAADHQLRREPGRDRRPHRRADLGLVHHPGGPGPRRDPEDRRAADQAVADQPVDGLGDARPGGARPGDQGGPDRPRPGAPVPALLLPLPRASSPGWGCSSTRSSSWR